MSDDILEPYINSIIQMIVDYPESFDRLDENLKINKDLMLLLVNQDSRFFYNLPDILKNDKDIILSALLTNQHVLGEVSLSLRDDMDIMLKALSLNGCALKYASDAQKQNRTLVEAAIEQTGIAIQYAHITLLEDRELSLKAVQQNGKALFYLLDKYKNDRDIVLTAVNGQKHKLILNIVPDCFRSDLEVVISALYQSFNNQQFISPELEHHPVVKFVLDNNTRFEILKDETHWPIIKKALLEQQDRFFNPPPIIKELANETSNKYVILAQYALNTYCVNIDSEHVELPPL